jgi:CubicO group peptidase (beta-lactamase class C family)
MSTIDDRVTEMLNRWPAFGLAVGVVRDGELAQFRGHGFADIAARTPVTEDTVFRIASISKTMTGVAVMQLHERGLVDLDAPANEYLRAFQLVPARAGLAPGDRAASADPHRRPGELAHASGMVRPDFGESVPVGRAAADAGRVLPGRAAVARRAGHPVHVQQPQLRHAGPAGRGRERQAVRPVSP